MKEFTYALLLEIWAEIEEDLEMARQVRAHKKIASG